MKKHDIHQYAELFPPMDADDRQRVRESLKINGQLEPIVLFEGKTLDGVNREQILIDDLKTEPRYTDYEDLPQEERGNSPLEFVMARNQDRRHLTKSQLAAIAAEALPFFEKQAKEQKQSGNGQAAPDPMNQETGHKPEDESQVRKGGKKKGKATVAAAKAFGVSARQVERAKAVKKKDPKKFEDVRKGKITLTKAERDENKVKAKAAERDEAVKRVGQVCGKAMADIVKAGEILKGKELLDFANMSDADMQKTRGLISAGWKVKKAKQYKQTALTLTSKIGELITRAVAQGAAQRGVFKAEFKHPAGTFDVTVRIASPVD